jgi:hypothetical protein
MTKQETIREPRIIRLLLAAGIAAGALITTPQLAQARQEEVWSNKYLQNLVGGYITTRLNITNYGRCREMAATKTDKGETVRVFQCPQSQNTVTVKESNGRTTNWGLGNFGTQPPQCAVSPSSCSARPIRKY